MGITTGANVPSVTGPELEQARQRPIVTSGRPSLYSPMLVAEILVRLEEGESLQAICRDDHMPSTSTVYDWKGCIPAFAGAFTRARRSSATSLVEDGLVILDGLEGETDNDGNPVSMATVRLAEMRARYRMELAKAYDRDTYGDNRRITAV